MHTIPGVRVGPCLPAHHSNNAAGPLHAVPSWSNPSSSSHAPHRRLLQGNTQHTAVHAAFPKVGIVAVPEDTLATARLPQQPAQQQPAPVQVRTSIRRSRVAQQHKQDSQSSAELQQQLTAVQHATQHQQQQLWLAQAAAQQQPDPYNSNASSRDGRQSAPRQVHASEQQLPQTIQLPQPLRLPQQQQHQPRQQLHINSPTAFDPQFAVTKGPTAFQQSQEQQLYQQQRSNQQQQQQQRQGPLGSQGRPQQQQPWHKAQHQQQQWQGQGQRQPDWDNPKPRQQQPRPDKLQQTRPLQSPEDSPEAAFAAALSSDVSITSTSSSSSNSQVFFSHGLHQDWSLPTGLAVTYLGSSSGAPTKDRNVSCTVLRLPEALYLVDCGEGSSRQMKLTGMQLEQIDALFITHLHGDHCFGIGTMLVAICKARKAAAAAAAADHASSSSSSSGYDSPSALRIVGPPRLGELVSTMLYIAGVGRQLDQPVYITEFVESESAAHDWQALPLPPSASSTTKPVAAFIRRMAPTQQLDRHEWPSGLDRRLERTGLRWQEMRRPQSNWYAKTGLLWQIPCRQAVVTAAQLQHRVPCWGYVFDEIVQPTPSSSRSSSSSGTSARGRRVVLLGDTVDSLPIAPAAHGADLVSHEATFAAGMEQKACVAQHSTAWMAGQFAWAIQAKALVLTHFSARYEGSQRDASKGAPGGAGAAASEGEGEERAHQALKREADDQYGLGPVLLAIDLLSAHVRKPEEPEES